MKNVLIIGAGGHAQVIADLISCVAVTGEKISVAGFLDDDSQLWGLDNLFGKIYGPISKIRDVPHDCCIVAIGDNAIRRKIFTLLQSSGESIISLVHPKAIVASDVNLGAGTVVFPGAVINTGSTVQENSIINTGATVDHHNAIGSHVHIAPGSHLGGGVSIEDGAFLGIGSLVIPGRTVGSWSTIGAGSVVLKNIPSDVTAFGVPAKIKFYNSSR